MKFEIEDDLQQPGKKRINLISENDKEADELSSFFEFKMGPEDSLFVQGVTTNCTIPPNGEGRRIYCLAWCPQPKKEKKR